MLIVVDADVSAGGAISLILVHAIVMDKYEQADIKLGSNSKFIPVVHDSGSCWQVPHTFSVHIQRHRSVCFPLIYLPKPSVFMSGSRFFWVVSNYG